MLRFLGYLVSVYVGGALLIGSLLGSALALALSRRLSGTVKQAQPGVDNQANAEWARGVLVSLGMAIGAANAAALSQESFGMGTPYVWHGTPTLATMSAREFKPWPVVPAMLTWGAVRLLSGGL